MIDRHRKSFLTKERRSSKGCSAKNVMAQPLEGGSHQCACAQQTSRSFRTVLEAGCSRARRVSGGGGCAVRADIFGAVFAEGGRGGG